MGNFFLLFAFLSSSRSISKCGKISKLLALCCGQLNHEFFIILPAVGGAYL